MVQLQNPFQFLQLHMLSISISLLSAGKRMGVATGRDKSSVTALLSDKLTLWIMQK